MSTFLLCVLAAVATFYFVVVEASPLLKVEEQCSNCSYFWYPSPDGGYVKAYLEGGPRFDPKASENDIKFYLFTLQNPNTRQELVIGNNAGLDSSNYVKGAPLKILSHGFTSNSNNDPAAAFKEAYFRQGYNYNVIAVDWAPLAAAPWYNVAAEATRTVGEKTGRLVEWLVSRGVVALDQVHFAGHSLGSHVGGFFGSYFGSGRVSRITALDPALPLFGAQPDSERIDPSDAAFVDVIHTAGGSLLEGGLAFEDPRGHVDFYPNSGTSQPGCGADAFGTCSHGRGMDYMAESIGNPSKFKACKCNSWSAFEKGQCACTETAAMGEHVSRSSQGNFYLYTNSASPFSQS